MKMLFRVLWPVLFILTSLFYCGPIEAKTVRTLWLSQRKIATVNVGIQGTILEFPAKPQNVVLGRKKSFDIVYVENDLAISPMATNSHSNLFVYVLGRRYALELTTRMNGGDDLILVRDEADQKIGAKPK
ncbi:MAG: hypothetical protein ABL958_01600 [Bdellovibrionia bacterium]